MIEVKTFPDFQKSAEAGGKRLALEMSASRVPTMLLICGGSGLAMLPHVGGYAITRDWALGVLDERITGNSADQNIEGLRATKLYQTAVTAQATIFTIRQEGSLASIARDWETQIREWLTNHPEHRIIITQGIGREGHTAGIFPGYRFDHPDALVAGYEAKGTKFPKRVTVTLPFLRTVDVSVVYAVGPQKRDALMKTLDTDGDLSAVPARIIQEMPRVFLFTDQPVGV